MLNQSFVRSREEKTSRGWLDGYISLLGPSPLPVWAYPSPLPQRLPAPLLPRAGAELLGRHFPGPQ